MIKILKSDDEFESYLCIFAICRRITNQTVINMIHILFLYVHASLY